jgi:lysozyme family protein
MKVDDILTDILRREGGFTADKEDDAHYGLAQPRNGRPFDCTCTNLGITQATLSAYYGRQASIEEVRNLSPDLAREIYATRYFSGPRLHTLPEPIQAAMLDASVNSGPRRAVIFLQAVLNQAGYGPMQCDGAVGPTTRAAAERAQQDMGAMLLAALIEQRRAFLADLVKADPGDARFWRGWMRRLREFVRAAAAAAPADMASWFAELLAGYDKECA